MNSRDLKEFKKNFSGCKGLFSKFSNKFCVQLKTIFKITKLLKELTKFLGLLSSVNLAALFPALLLQRFFEIPFNPLKSIKIPLNVLQTFEIFKIQWNSLLKLYEFFRNAIISLKILCINKRKCKIGSNESEYFSSHFPFSINLNQYFINEECRFFSNFRESQISYFS